MSSMILSELKIPRSFWFHMLSIERKTIYHKEKIISVDLEIRDSRLTRKGHQVFPRF